MTLGALSLVSGLYMIFADGWHDYWPETLEFAAMVSDSGRTKGVKTALIILLLTDGLLYVVAGTLILMGRREGPYMFVVAIVPGMLTKYNPLVPRDSFHQFQKLELFIKCFSLIGTGLLVASKFEEVLNREKQKLD